jgi:hypothetical protein
MSPRFLPELFAKQKNLFLHRMNEDIYHTKSLRLLERRIEKLLQISVMARGRFSRKEIERRENDENFTSRRNKSFKAIWNV